MTRFRVAMVSGAISSVVIVGSLFASGLVGATGSPVQAPNSPWVPTASPVVPDLTGLTQAQAQSTFDNYVSKFASEGTTITPTLVFKTVNDPSQPASNDGMIETEVANIGKPMTSSTVITLLITTGGYAGVYSGN